MSDRNAKAIVKVDPITGQKVAFGEVPFGEEVPAIDHEGLLVFVIEGPANEYQFNQATRQLGRTDKAVVFDLRRRLVEEQRGPTAEELTILGMA